MPWGTPDKTGAQSDFTPFTTTRCCPKQRKESIHFNASVAFFGKIRRFDSLTINHNAEYKTAPFYKIIYPGEIYYIFIQPYNWHISHNPPFCNLPPFCNVSRSLQPYGTYVFPCSTTKLYLKTIFWKGILQKPVIGLNNFCSTVTFAWLMITLPCTSLLKERYYISPVKRICVFEHSAMTNFNCACPAIQRSQWSGFLSEGSSWLTACMSEQQRFWRDCADAKARLNLRCSHRR